MTSLKIQITVEAKTASAVKAMGDLAGATGKAKTKADELTAAQKKQAQEMEQNRARVDNARDRISAFGQAMDKAMSQAKSMTSSVGGFGSAISALKGPVLAGVGVIAGLAVAADSVSRESLKVQAVFRNLPFALGPARQATAGLVDDLTLATKANQASSLGVAQNAEEFAKLSRAAQALGQKLGTSTEDAFESLVAAVGRGSSAMLDNLGIVVKQEQAQEQYAQKLGKATSELTKSEQAEAFRKVALEKIFAAADQVTVVTDGAAAATQRYRVELENLKTSALGGSERVISLAEGMAQLSRTEIEGARDIGQYGATVEKLKDRLHALGVEYSAMPKTIADWRWELSKAHSDLVTASIAADQAANSMSAFRTQLDNVRKARKSDDDINALASRAGDLRQLEDQIAFDMARGVSVSAALTEQTKIRVEFLEREGKHEEAVALLRADEVRLIQERGAALRKNAATKREELSLEEQLFKAELARAKAKGGTLTDASQAGAFDRSRAANDAIDQARKDLVGSQLERTPKKSALDIEREKIALLQEAREAAAARSKALHDAEMARQKALQDRAERAGVAVGDSLASIAQASLQAGDLSARGFRRVLAEWGKAESLKLASIAISEAVQALVSAATYNFAAAAMHGAAAAQAGLGAAAILALTGAVGGFGSISKKPKPGFSGDQFGAGQAANTPATAELSNSQEDSVPLSTRESAQHVTKKGGGKGTTIVVNAQVLGAIDKTTGLKLAQGIRAAERSLGRTGS
ncbi:MAG: hypothetical protein IPN32_39180 [Deltaproteobacteria bacterium]|nr:hypothetical protein [Deltaproteobacteria bacterium]